MHIVSRLQQYPLDLINLNNHMIGCISTFNKYNKHITITNFLLTARKIRF